MVARGADVFGRDLIDDALGSSGRVSPEMLLWPRRSQPSQDRFLDHAWPQG
ncbi:MAG TPA: hypothetical protein VG388_03125 [Solirubrobacteraceae bacterium]|jgi:hypothetical protein|nr:hypothetical protein [Solirubrobacteraceae bacterium]